MNGAVVYLTGPPASGKTTVARAVLQRLRARETSSLWLDSDDLRRVLTPNASYSDLERDHFYAAIAHLARLGAQGGTTVVVSATANRRVYRDSLRALVPVFVEVHLRCAPEILEARDPKGLYARARAGEIKALPGFGANYEAPEHPELVVDSGRLDPEQAADLVLARLDALR